MWLWNLHHLLHLNTPYTDHLYFTFLSAAAAPGLAVYRENEHINKFIFITTVLKLKITF